MKKLAIMFVMLLGSVATMQAQTFDFVCDDSLVDNSNGGFVESSTSMLSAGFTLAQMTSLEDIGFMQDVDPAGDEVLAKLFGEVSIQLPDTDSGYAGSIITDTPIVSVQVGTFYDDRDATDVASRGPWEYRILINSPSGGRYSFVHFYNDTDDALAFLMSLYPNAVPLMVYQDGYPDADEDVLVDNGFMFDTTMSQYVLHRSANDWVYIPAPNADGSYTYENADTDVVDGTLAEILANYEING